MRAQRPGQWGFTLVEMIMVIVITGILGTMVAVFIQAPVQGYVDSSRRAEMTDIADTALRRLARDIRTAVPNSIRVATCGGVPCIEFLPTRAGGRYRTGAPGNMLEFGVADVDGFDIIGPPITFTAGDRIVVGSTQSDGNPPYNTTAAGILRAYTGATGAPQATVIFDATSALPVWAEVQGQRFDVVDGAQQAVTYACIGVLGALDANNDGQAALMRYWSYGYNVAQVAPPVGVNNAVLANRVSGCTITYNAISQRNGLVTIALAITRGNETVSLYHEIHVNNVP